MGEVKEPEPPAPKKREWLPHKLPFSNWWPLLIGAAIGITLRLIFSGRPGTPYAAMQTVFIFLVPMAVGAITVYVAERTAPRSWSYCIWAPAVANTLFVLGTMVILIEGLICAILVLPLFGAFGALGGVIMGWISRKTRRRDGAASGFVALPVVLAVLGVQPVEPEYIGTIERAIVIDAAPQKIWHEIHDARDIRPDEVGQAWMYRLGVPMPISGITEETPAGFVRRIRMGKSIHFDQVATDWDENRYVRWTYRFDDDSFPPHALDDHVAIGGRYFDLIDTSYRLTSRDARTTELRITMHYRVSTQFNWYADGVAKLLIGNFEDVILGFYRSRAERAA